MASSSSEKKRRRRRNPNDRPAVGTHPLAKITASANTKKGAGGGAAAAAAAAASSKAKFSPGAVAISPKFKTRVEACVAELNAAAGARDGQDGWSKSSSSRGVTCFTQAGEYATAKGHARVKAPARAVFGFILSEESNSANEQMEFQEKKGKPPGDPGMGGESQEELVYMRFKAVWPTAARDMTQLVHWRAQDDGR